MIKIDGIKMSVDSSEKDALKKAIKLIGTTPERIYISKRSIDARKKSEVHFVYSVVAEVANEDKVIGKIKNASKFSDELYSYPLLKKSVPRPVVVGSGPAGSFAALLLAHAGAKPVILERGKPVEARKKDVEGFFCGKALMPDSNVQFGEGGAGTFSDGKLTTGTGSKYIRKILSEYVRFGAPERILWEAKPHIGTDILAKIAVNIRKEVESLGGEYLFSDKLRSITTENGRISGICANEKIDAENVILALGHSARDTFFMLKESGVYMEQKPFSVGMRIEHLQEYVDKARYGKLYGHKNLPPADYKFADDCYSFCMCPGGYVVSAASEEISIVTNGMSFSGRDGQNANSALLVNVNYKDFGEEVFDGMYFQERLERAAYNLSGSYAAPSQKLSDFVKGFKTASFGSVKPTYRPGVTPCNIREFMPERICDRICTGIFGIDRRMEGFASADAVLTAPETRSSSPVRIVRNPDTLESVSLDGLYPCGEGAGYAGGIMSAAADGLRCAERLVKKYNEE